MFRNILVHIPSERPVRPVIDVAVGLTIARRSHLDAVAVGYESMSTVGMVVEGGGAAVAAVMGNEQERALERRDPLEDHRPSCTPAASGPRPDISTVAASPRPACRRCSRGLGSCSTGAASWPPSFWPPPSSCSWSDCS